MVLRTYPVDYSSSWTDHQLDHEIIRNFWHFVNKFVKSWSVYEQVHELDHENRFSWLQSVKNIHSSCAKFTNQKMKIKKGNKVFLWPLCRHGREWRQDREDGWRQRWRASFREQTTYVHCTFTYILRTHTLPIPTLPAKKRACRAKKRACQEDSKKWRMSRSL